MTLDIAIIGDNFMRSDFFEDAIREACGARASCRGIDLGWPDEPITQGYDGTGLPGINEYQGDPDRMVAHIGTAPVLVTHNSPITAGMLDLLPDLKLIVVSRGGPVNIDRTAAQARGVTVVNTPGRNASAVAEFTIGSILAHLRNIAAGHEAMRQGTYRNDLYRADVVGDELCDMTVGVIGYGAIGTRVTRLLRAFGCKVLVCDPYVQLDPEDRAAGVDLVSRETLLAQSDLVTLHPRVTEETKQMMNAEAFAAMKPGAVVVNTARGPLMDYDALLDALQSGHLGGAMLETFPLEPVPEDSPFLRLANVTLTPHIAGASLRTVRVAAGKAADEIRRWLDGEPPLNPC